MPINTICTGCGKALSVADEHASKRARCPACGQIYTVPLASTTNGAGVSDGSGGVGVGSGDIFAPQVSSGSAASGPAGAAAINWGPTAASPAPSGQASGLPNQFWMRASDGAVYGPVNRENLDRWFKEGRVGLAYQIRQGETGMWQEASNFRPQIQVNPYAATTAASQAQPGSRLHRYPKPDRGAVVLIMGILAFMICGVFGIIAVVMGRTALRDIEAGQANPNDKTLVQIGFWLGVANLVLHLLAIGGFLLLIAIGIISEAG